MIPKRSNALFLLLFLTAVCCLAPLTASPFNGSLRGTGGKSTTVVVDAGHGGRDPGGMGANSREKHIALSIAQLFAEGIRANYPSVNVILTRNDDTFIPLYERAAIANRAGADLFVSIHANIMPGSRATYGTETFVMGQHVAEHNLRVAKRENASIFLEEDFEKNYDYDPNSDEGHILMNMFQHAFLERSILFAELVEQQFANHGRKSRGVKQAGFVVLKETTMPSVLVETGFMSNPTEEAYLLSEAGQKHLANALLVAFGEYYNIVNKLSVTVPEIASRPVPTSFTPKGVTAATAPPPTAPASVPTAPATPTVSLVKYDETPQAAPKSFTPKGVTTAATPMPTAPASVPTAPATPTVSLAKFEENYSIPVSKDGSSVQGTIIAYPEPDVLEREVAPTPIPEADRVVPVSYNYYPSRVVYGQPARDTNPPTAGYQFQNATTLVPAPRKAAPSDVIDLSTIPDQQLEYAVQIIATRNPPDLTASPYNQLPYPIKLVQEGGWNKYEIRGLLTAQQAEAARIRARDVGFDNPMIIVRHLGKKLARPQVQYLLNR